MRMGWCSGEVRRRVGRAVGERWERGGCSREACSGLVYGGTGKGWLRLRRDSGDVERCGQGGGEMRCEHGAREGAK